MSKSNTTINSRIVRIKMIDGTRINGQVNIDREPGHDRVSDLVGTNNDDFLVVFDATLHENGIDNPVKIKTIFVNKDHIQWAIPDDDQK